MKGDSSYYVIRYHDYGDSDDPTDTSQNIRNDFDKM